MKYTRKPVEKPRGPRSKKMIPAIKELIGRHSNDRDENGELFKREKLADDLIKMINTRYPKETPPAPETIQKLISKSRHYKGSALDKPWSMASLTEYPIPYDAIPYVVALAEDFSNSSSPISIRIALWIGRIFVLEDKDKKKIQQLYLMGSDQGNSSEVYSKMLELTKDYEWTLFFTAIRYCMYEKACGRVGLIPVDTSIFDALSLDDINKKMDLYFYGTNDTEVLNERVTNLKNGLPVEWTDNELERRWNRIKNKDGV